MSKKILSRFLMILAIAVFISYVSFDFFKSGITGYISYDLGKAVNNAGFINPPVNLAPIIVGLVSAAVIIASIVEVRRREAYSAIAQKTEELRPKVEEAVKIIPPARTRAKNEHETQLEIIMDHVYYMAGKGLSYNAIRKYLEELHISKISIDYIVHEMQENDNRMEQLISFVKAQVKKKKSFARIKKQLLSRGWHEDLIRLVLNY